MPQSVFITGVSTGIGASLVDYYLSQGWEVFGCSRRTPLQFAEQTKFRFVSCNLAKFSQIPTALEQLFNQIDACDLVILNAGILSRFGDMQTVSIAECQQVMDVNLWANKAVLDWLLGSSLAIQQVVTISSGAAVNGNRGWNSYAISKAALNMLTALYANETPGTHFSALAPGLVETAMQETLCSLPEDNRFPTLDTLRAGRHTKLMPSPQILAPRLANAIKQIPRKIVSGSFIDIRKLPWEDS